MSNLADYLALPVHTIDAGGTPITYRVTGEGPPLLMIHGWPLCGATYRDYVAALRTRFTCIVPDLPGSGATPWDPTTRNMLIDWGGLMARFVDALGLERFGVIAHDSGGTMARVMAAELGDRVAAMAFGNTEISNHGSLLLSAIQASLKLPGADRIFARLLRSPTYLRSMAGLRGAFHDTDVIFGDFYEACIEPVAQDARNARLAFKHADLSSVRELPRVHAQMTSPCLLIWGEDDPFFPLAPAREMLTELPAGSSLEVIPDARLFVHEEHPQQVLSLAEPFFSKHLC